MLYRKALELVVKSVDSDINAMLGKRIEKLVKQGMLITSIGEWATQVVYIANEATHDDKEIDRDDLSDLRNITVAIIENLISMPETVKNLREKKA